MYLNALNALHGRANLGLTVITPDGKEVTLTEEEEKGVVKEALKEGLKSKMTAWDRRMNTVIDGALSAAGYAVGITAAGIILALVVRKIGAKQPKLPG